MTDKQKALDDLLFRLDWWGNLHYKEGCEYAHEILLDYRNDIIAALTATTWQPIESAPRDGAEILLYVSGEYGELKHIGAYWYEEEPTHVWRGRLGCWLNEDTPTHWMPLPPAPKGIEG